MVRDYGRDLDIGIPTTKNLTRPVEVQNFEDVVTSVENVASKVDETNVHAKRIADLAGMNMGIGSDEVIE